MNEGGKSIEQRQKNEIASQYLITAKQFFDEGYEQKIKDGEVEVFEYNAMPGPEASDEVKHQWATLTEKYGNGLPMTTATKLREGYYDISGFGMDGDHQLLVLTKAK